MSAEPVSVSVDVLAAQVRRQREQLRRAAEDGERLYRKRMHEDDWTGAEDNRVDGILTRELVDALALVDALVARVTEAERALAFIAGEYGEHPESWRGVSSAELAREVLARLDGSQP